MGNYKIEAGTGQHIGDRDEQQDRVALIAAPKAPGYMMAVLADGMGGAGGGAIAAEQAVRTAKQVFEHFSPLTDAIETMLHAIADEVHTIIEIMRMASELRPQTTLAMLVLTPERTAVWGHAGDSRIYRYAGPNLAERTVDHSYVEPGNPRYRSAASPDLPRSAALPPASTVLLNVLGKPGPAPVLTIGRYAELQAGDAFMLCTDGLWHHCNDAECGAAIAMNPPRDAAQMLIKKARERATGNADNCSLAIVKLVPPMKEIHNHQVDRPRRAV